MILVDTSVWIDHFHRSEPRLVQLLTKHQVKTHPIVIGELATGNLKHRHQTLTDLQSLPTVVPASFAECLELIERRQLHGLGLGWNDVQLLASALVENIPMWTTDKRFSTAADSLGCAFPR